MFLLLLLSLTLAVLVNLVQSNPIIEGRYVGEVINNKFVQNPAKYPFLVLLEIREINLVNLQRIVETAAICGGSILTDDIVLTAAHCLEIFVSSPHVTVFAGIVHRKLEKPAHKTCVKSYLVHERYTSLEIVESSRDSDVHHNDIALLWMEKKFTFNFRVGPATIVKGDIIKEYRTGTIVGWGITEYGEESDLLKESELNILDNNHCKDYYNLKISDKELCGLADNKKTTICTGDSGGPIIVNNIVVGVASYNRRKHGDYLKCDPTSPAVFTKVSAYYSWIEDNRKKGSLSQRALGLPFPVSDTDLECLTKNNTPTILAARKTTTTVPKQCDKKSKKRTGRGKDCVIS